MQPLTSAQSRAPDRTADRRFFLFNAAISAGALMLLGWILLVRRGTAPGGVDLHVLPAVNASLNALACSLLLAGRVAIYRGSMRVHRTLMVAAFVASSLFLVCYLAYHSVHGETHYAGTGAARTAYLTILASHVLLSATVVPLALTAFWFAFRREFVRHRKVTRVLWPVWMYVSVTGVLIFFLLRGSYGH